MTSSDHRQSQVVATQRRRAQSAGPDSPGGRTPDRGCTAPARAPPPTTPGTNKPAKYFIFKIINICEKKEGQTVEI